MQPWQEKGQIRIFKCFNELSINMNIFAFPFFRKKLDKKEFSPFLPLTLLRHLAFLRPLFWVLSLLGQFDVKPINLSALSF